MTQLTEQSLGYQNSSQHYSESSTWELQGGKPIEVKGQDVENVLLINHQISVCLDCP